MNIGVNINIEKAQAIDGWMTDRELTWLAEQAASRQVIVEIGSYLGRSTRALCDHTWGHVYAIDDWAGPRDVEIDVKDRNQIFNRFIKNMAGLEGKLLVCRQDHGSAEIPEGADMVFLDGDHRYESISRDIKLWLPRLKPGGILCGHDLLLGSVNQALRNLLPSFERVPNTILWYYEPPPKF